MVLRSAVQRLRDVAQALFQLYEKHPYTANSIVGAAMFTAGELSVQYNLCSVGGTSKAVSTSDEDKEGDKATVVDWPKVLAIGALGAVQNGAFAVKWYQFLNRVIGSGISTRIVLIKCLLDQLFFATQLDFSFLALCAYNDFREVGVVMDEVRDTFLTTWIMDCSIWPVVNFFGFAFLPYQIQPTYIAFISYFWQVYLSSIASAENVTEIAKLRSLFNEIDVNKNGYLEASEILLAFSARGIPLSEDELHSMIAESTASYSSSESASARGGSAGQPDDGRITFEEFKQVALKGSKLNTSKLWESVRNAPIKVPADSVDIAVATAAAASLGGTTTSAVAPASLVVAPEPLLSISMVKLPQIQPFGYEYAALPVSRPIAVPTDISQATAMDSLRSKIRDDRVVAYKSAAAGTTLLAICAVYRRFVKHL